MGDLYVTNKRWTLEIPEAPGLRFVLRPPSAGAMAEALSASARKVVGEDGRERSELDGAQYNFRIVAPAIVDVEGLGEEDDSGEIVPIVWRELDAGQRLDAVRRLSPWLWTRLHAAVSERTELSPEGVSLCAQDGR